MPPPKKTFKNASTHKPLKKGKPRIEKIDFKEKSEEIKRKWEIKNLLFSLHPIDLVFTTV